MAFLSFFFGFTVTKSCESKYLDFFQAMAGIMPTYIQILSPCMLLSALAFPGHVEFQPVPDLMWHEGKPDFAGGMGDGALVRFI